VPITLPIAAYGFAATFKLRELTETFSFLGHVGVRKDRLLVSAEGRRYVVAYDFGAVVFIGVDPDAQTRLIAELTKRIPPEPYPPTTESFLIEIEPGASAEVRFDRVVVPELSAGAVDIVAEVVAQSVAMDYYAKDVEEIEVETDRIASLLRTEGRVPGPVRKLVQFIGLCIATRNDVISTLALFDKPDATWESEQLDRLWNGLHHILEIGDRYRALEAKLRMFQDNLEVLADLTRQRQTFFVEVAIVVLILLEMLIMVWQVFASTGRA
jgi:uncharacterized Rmd1/YagE family protein